MRGGRAPSDLNQTGPGRAASYRGQRHFDGVKYDRSLVNDRSADGSAGFAWSIRNHVGVSGRLRMVMS